MRAFIALEIPEETRQYIFLKISSIAVKCGARPIKEKSLHITLEFLGEINDNLASSLSDALSAIQAKSFEASLGSVSTFGTHSNVAFMNLEKGRKEAIDLHGMLRERLLAINEIKQRLDKREFLPGSLNKLASLSQGLWADSGPFKISTIALKRSVLLPDGAEYETIFSKNLA